MLMLSEKITNNSLPNLKQLPSTVVLPRHLFPYRGIQAVPVIVSLSTKEKYRELTVSNKATNKYVQVYINFYATTHCEDG